MHLGIGNRQERAWQYCNRYLSTEGHVSKNSTIAFNPDFLALSETDFRNWSLHGLTTFSDMFDEESKCVKSFAVICAEYQINQNLHEKGQLRLHPSEFEQFIIPATFLLRERYLISIEFCLKVPRTPFFFETHLGTRSLKKKFRE